ASEYTVAGGQEGGETPEGLYSIEWKEVDPTWHVPESAWAGSLAGQDIPPGPSNPIKARWLGIFEGAGIPGTEETWAPGSTSGSERCDDRRISASSVARMQSTPRSLRPCFAWLSHRSQGDRRK